MAVSPTCPRTQAPRGGAESHGQSRLAKRNRRNNSTTVEGEEVRVRGEENGEEEGIEKDAEEEKEEEVILLEMRRMRKMRGAMKVMGAAA